MNFDTENINMFNGATGFLGQYMQDISFGDTTEKEYSYIFNIFDKNDNIVATSGEKIHDISEDNLSNISNDIWKTYQTFKSGEVYYLQYTITTINGLVISTIKYKIMEIISSPIEFNIQIHAAVDYDNGLIDLSLQGDIRDDSSDKYYYQNLQPDAEFDDDIVYFIEEDNNFIEFTGDLNDWDNLLVQQKLFIKITTIYKGEQPYSGQFVIVRSSFKSNFMDWVEITRFSLANQLPSIIHHKDITVEQGIEYKYALQQYNIHGLYSQKQYQTDDNGNFNTVIANFDSIFLTDGIRQLKVYFNPQISSFKNTILEDKIEAIGSKYPYIVRNGIVSYKEFPLQGLISYQMDTAKLFLTEEEQIEAGILEYSIRQDSAYISDNKIVGFEQNIYFDQVQHEVRDPSTGKVLYTEILSVMKRKPKITYKQIINRARTKSISKIDNTTGNVKNNTDLTDENTKSERYFKLKVLDWLTDGNVKLFRSPEEGNYLVRLVNISFSPENTLGRMLHNFSCTAYEIDELTYDNLIKYGIITEKNIINMIEQWSSIDLSHITTNNEFIQVSPMGISINNIIINNFAPGDQIKLNYANSTESNIFTIGVTGSLELTKEERQIATIFVKFNDQLNQINRELIYSHTAFADNGFNTIAKVFITTTPAEQFVGPKSDLLKPFNLKNEAYGVFDEDGKIISRISEADGIENIYNDLMNKNHINYDLGDISNSNYHNYNLKKFTVLKVDHLHVWKREVVPIFAYDTNEITETTPFGLTPFGNGYINNKPITDYIETSEEIIQHLIQYAEPVLQQDEDGDWNGANNINPKDLETVISSNTYYTNDKTLIFEAFVFDTSLNKWVSSGQYYDNFTRTWGNEYNPTFSINTGIDYTPKENNTTIYRGDPIISLNEIDELVLYNLGHIDKIELGNGVIAEVTPQIRIIDYDIEESIEEVRAAKADYQNAKTQLFDSISDIVVNAGSKEELEQQKAQLQQEEDITRQKIESLGVKGPYESVSLIAKERLIEQKQKMWDDRQGEFAEILQFLLNQQIYDALEAETAFPICRKYSMVDTPDDLTESQAIEIQEHLNKINSGNAENNDIFSANTQPASLSFYNSPSSIKEIDKIEYDFINQSTYIDVDYYERQKQNNLTIINNYNAQISELQEQQGDLIGDYNADASPENTISYYNYLIAQVKEQQAAELAKVNKVKVELINQLLRVDINQTMDILRSISTATSTYLKDNAEALLTLLGEYKNEKDGRLSTIQNQCAIDLGKIIFNVDVEEINDNQRNDIINYLLRGNEYNNALINENNDITSSQILVNIADNVLNISLSTLIEELKKLVEKIDTNVEEIDKESLRIKNLLSIYLTSQDDSNNENLRRLLLFLKVYDNYAKALILESKALEEKITNLNKIILFPGDSENNYGVYTTPDYTETHARFNEKVDTVRDTYVDAIQEKINDLLSDNFNNFVASRIQANSEAFALLDLFTNEVNESQASTIKSYLNQYYPANTNDLISDLVKQIQNQDAIYVKKVNTLNKTISEYIALRDNLQSEVDSIQVLINDLENKSANQKRLLEENTKQLEQAELLKDVLDSRELFNNFIVNEQTFQFNAELLRRYLLWVEYTQDLILRQGGQASGVIEDSQTYINWLKDFINAYEEEAFEFLHKYDSIKEDLQTGISNEITDDLASSLGTDRFFYALNKFKLNVYENILYILDKNFDLDTYNTLMPQLISEDSDTRKQAYEDLLEYLNKLFIGEEKEKDNNIEEEPEEEKIKTELVLGLTMNGELVALESDDEVLESQYYPSIFTIGEDSQQVCGIDNGRYIDNVDYTLLREKTASHYFDVETNEEGKYVQNIYNNSDMYYTMIDGKIVEIEQLSGLSSEEFNEKVSKLKQNNQSVFWISTSLPVQLHLQLHSFLYSSNLADFQVEEDLTLRPKFLNQFKDFLGNIVHYISTEGEEYGSYYALVNSDVELFGLIGSYFNTQDTIIKTEEKPEMATINQSSARTSNYYHQWQEWLQIYNDCQIVRENYINEGIPDTDEKQQQLIILLKTAQDKIKYYQELYQNESQATAALIQKADLTEYYAAISSLDDIKAHLTQIEDNFNRHYEIYKHRVKHYLKLLLNNIPYGEAINSNVVVNKNILAMSDGKTYNFGIAYLIEKFQEYRFNDEIFAFEVLNNIVQEAKRFKVWFNYHFPLIIPVVNETKHNDYTMYFKYNNETDDYSEYLYIDEEHWNQDVSNDLVYYTDYPYLSNFINYFEYIQLNDYFLYDEKERYYLIGNQNEFIRYNIQDAEEFFNMRERLYIKGNGGIKKFLDYIYGTGTYVDDITTNYNGTLELFDKLLEQIKNSTLPMEELNKKLNTLIAQINNLDKQIQKISQTNIDVDSAINSIKQKLAKYLYVLTINYVQSVEGVYDEEQSVIRF